MRRPNTTAQVLASIIVLGAIVAIVNPHAVDGVASLGRSLVSLGAAMHPNGSRLKHHVSVAVADARLQLRARSTP